MVVGASFDSVEAQKKFADEEGFPYRLLADVDKVMGTAYLADQPDKGYPRRISYLINPEGGIVRTYDLAGQALAEHATVVLDDIRVLS